MKHHAISLRPFIGSKDFEQSRSFYRDLGFEEQVIGPGFSRFGVSGLSFYLQDYYVKEWVDNTMIFLEVDDVQRYWDELLRLNLPAKYDGVKLIPVKVQEWGRECFLHDPSGVLWHFGEFI